MKFNKMITFGLAVHAGLALVLVSQTGCSTVKMPWSDNDAENHHASTDEMPSMYLDEVKEQKKVVDADDNFMPLDVFQADPEAPTDHSLADNAPAAGYHVPVRQAPRRPDWDLFPEDTAPSSSDYWNQPGAAAGSDYVVVKGDSLWAISKKKGVSLNELMSANGLNKSSVLRIGQVLTIPGGTAAAPKRSTKPAYSSSGKTYTVCRGDTLSAIGRRHNVSVRDLQNANGLTGHMIYEGQNLNIPSSSAGYQTRADHQAAKRFQPTTEGGSYAVQPGDTLSNIAKRYNTSVQSLMANNNISDPRKLRAGQKLVVTGSSFKPVASTSSAPKGAKPGHYRVAQGDNLISIAKRHNTTVADLMTWNGIEDARTLRAGQEIRVSSPGYAASRPAPAPTPAAPAPSYSAPQPTQSVSFSSDEDLFSESAQADLLEMDTMDLFGDIDGLFDDGEQADLVSVVE